MANKSINSVKYVSKIQVPRYCGNNMSIKKPEIHIFLWIVRSLQLLTSESSKKNKAKVSLIIGKSRLAPLKEKRFLVP